MGIVDYAASTALASTGFALAAPYLQTKIPALEPVTRHVYQWAKLFAGFGIIGGGLGLVVAPLLAGWSIHQHGLAANLLVLPVLALLLLGCLGSIGLGIVAFRRPAPTEPHSGELDKTTIAGLAGIAYGGFLWMVFTVMTIVT